MSVLHPAFILRYLMTRTWASVLCLCLTGPAAIWAWAGLDRLGLQDGHAGFELAPCSIYGGSVRSGANIGLANAVVACAAIAVVIGVALAHNHQRRLASLLAIGGVALGVGIGLVAADSTTYAAGYSWSACRGGFASPLAPLAYVNLPFVGSVSAASWLLTAWGVTLVLVLLRAYGAWKGVEPPARRRRYRLPRAWQTGA